MKTSNKLLLSGALFVVLLFLVCNLYARKFIVKKDTNYLIGKGVKGQTILLENYDTDTLYLRHYNEYKLDPNSTSVMVEGDKEVLPAFGVKMYRGLYPYFNHDYISDHELPITYTIGVKGKSNLVIIAKDKASVWSSEKLNIENLTINANNNSSFIIDNDGENLIVVSKNGSTLDFDGSYKTGKFEVEYTGFIDAMKIEFENLDITLSERSSLRVKNAKYIVGELEDYSVFSTVDECDISSLKFYDKSKHKIESWD